MFRRRKPLNTSQRLRQFLWPREGWVRATKYLWQRTIRLNGSAHSIALGLAIGAFVSANPLLGTHILWGALIIYFIGGNFIAAVAGTWVGNPISFPFIWLATYNTGHFLLGTSSVSGEVPKLAFSTLTEAPFETILPMMVGWVPVGLVLGVATYYPSLWTVQAYQKQRAVRMARKAKADAEKSAK
jgi:uncharacterized protein (DUF2062 family)